MAKSKEAFRTISEVAAELEVPQHVLRFWETKFSQIKPLKRGGGRRYYRPEDVDLLKGIQRLLHTEGYTIKGVQKIFREHGAKAVQRGIIGGEKTGAAAAIATANVGAGRTPTVASQPKVAEPDLFGAGPVEALSAANRKMLGSLRDDLTKIRQLLKSTL